MKVTPRKAEVEAVVALMENSDYPSAEALAKDVIKTVAELFAEREWWAYGNRMTPDGSAFFWGPLSSEAEVTKLAKKAGLQGEHRALKLCSTGALLARIDDTGKSPNCTTCNHPHGAHEHPRSGGKCAVNWCTCVSDAK